MITPWITDAALTVHTSRRPTARASLPAEPTTPQKGPADAALHPARRVQRKKLVTPLVIIVVVAFWFQQIVTNFTSWMDGAVVSGLSWAYLYAFALFFLVIAVTTYYRRQMAAIEAKYKPSGTGADQ